MRHYLQLTVVLSSIALASWAVATPLFLSVPFFPDTTDQCGPSTLAGVLSYWGKTTTPSELRSKMYIAKLRGTLPMDMLFAAESYGLKARMVQGDVRLLNEELEAGRPVLVMLNTGFEKMPVNHYVIVTGLDEEHGKIIAHSAGKENKVFSMKKFLGQWNQADRWALLAHE